MFEQDYIVKQIRQCTNALERVLLKKKEGKQQEAQKIIEHSLNELPDDNSKKFHELSLQETIAVLENKGSFNAELALIVAELLFEKGQLVEKEESRKCFMQALLLFRKTMKNPNVAFPLEAPQKISRINNFLAPSDIEKVTQQLE